MAFNPARSFTFSGAAIISVLTNFVSIKQTIDESAERRLGMMTVRITIRRAALDVTPDEHRRRACRQD